MLNRDIIIAIDGFSSCGKSTFAKTIARYLGYAYIDTGAMYRAVTLHFLKQGILQGNKESKLDAINKAINKISISFQYNPETNESETYLNGLCVEKEIRGKAVANKVSEVAAFREVRNKLVDWQRKAGQNKRIVLDGRDIGTVVFPHAELKIFMTAQVSTRAQRRYLELLEKGMEQSLSEIENNIKERDFQDQNRKESPLRQAEDAIILDNSHMTPEQQMDWLQEVLIRKKLSGHQS